MGLFDFLKTNPDESKKDQLADLMSTPVFSSGLAKALDDCDEILGAKGDFGYTETNPIPVNGLIGQAVYLNRLLSKHGKRFLYHRRCL